MKRSEILRWNSKKETGGNDSRPNLTVKAGDHVRACLDVIEQEGRFVVKGLVGLPKEVGLAILNNPVWSIV